MKSDILGLGKDTIIYGVGSVINRFVGLITLPLFTSYLVPQEYGVLAMLMLLTMLAQPIFSLGLSAAMGPSYYESDDICNKSKVVWSVFAISLVSASVLVSFAWSFPDFLGALVRLPSEYSYLVSVSLTGSALTILVTSLAQRVQFERQARLYVAITVITAVTAVLVSIYTVVMLDLGVEGMVYGQFAGNAITFVAFTAVGLKATIPKINMRTAKEVLYLGIPLVPSFAFLFILMNTNRYILESSHGLDAVGIYSIGFNLGLAISIITGGFSTAWYPYFMKFIDTPRESEIIFGKIFSYYIIVIGFFTLCFFIFAQPVVMLLTHTAFHDAFLVVGLVATAFYFIGMYNLFLPGMYFKKEISVQSIIQAVAVVLSLPMAFFFVGQFGILGAAIIVAFGHGLMALLTHLWNLHRKKDYIQVSYEWRRVFKFLVFFSIVASIFIIIKFDTFLESLFFSIFGFIVAFLVAIQFMSRDEINVIPLLRYFKV